MECASYTEREIARESGRISDGKVRMPKSGTRTARQTNSCSGGEGRKGDRLGSRISARRQGKRRRRM